MIGDIFQPTHLLFILVIALLVLGPKRLPEVGKALGRGIRDFRNALSGDEIRDARDELRDALNTPTIETPRAPPDAASSAEAAETAPAQVEASPPEAPETAAAPTRGAAGEASGEAAHEPTAEDAETAKQHVG